MDPIAARRCLLWHGVMIVFLALLEGGIVQSLVNPRMALSAHTGGIMTGLLVGLFGLSWPDLTLSTSMRRVLFWLVLVQGYVNFAGLVLAAAFGTSGTTPLAGAGHAGAPWQEAVVALALVTGAVTVLAACVLGLWGLRRPSPNRRAGF